MLLQEIRNKVINGEPVTIQEYAFLLRNDSEAFFAFLVNNNPGALNNILRHDLGYTELGFKPDPKAIARLLDIIIDSKNQKEFDYIVQNFKVDTSKVSPELLQAIQEGDYTFTFAESSPENARTAQEIASNIGSSIGSFLNPLFGSSTTTTTTAPAPTAEKAGSKGILLVVVLAVLVVGAFLIFKKTNTAQ